MAIAREDGLQTTTVTDNNCTVDGITENPNPHPVDEDMQDKHVMAAKKDKNSFDGKTGLIITGDDYPNSTDKHHPKNQDKNPVGGKTGLMVPAHEEHDMQNQKVNSPSGAPEPVDQEASPAADKNKKYELIEENSKAKKKVKLEFACAVVLVGSSELLCIMFLPRYSVDRRILSAIAVLGFWALISGFCLMIHTFFMLAPSNRYTHSNHHTISKVLTVMSYTALVLASLPLSLLPKPYNLLIPIVLVAVLLTLGAHLYLRSKTNDEKTDEKDQSKVDQEEITRLSELSQVVMSLSSGGLIGLFFGIHKNASNHALHPVVFASVFLTFTSFIFGTSLMFLSQKRLMRLSSSTRKIFLNIGAGLSTFLLVLLAFVALLIAYTFLQVYTVMVLIPALIVCVIWVSIKFCTAIQDNLEEDEIKLSYTLGNKVISVSFGGLMAIFSGYLGSNEKNLHLNICMIFMASAFLSGLILMLLSYMSSTRSRIGITVSILGYYAISLLVFGLFSVFIVEIIQLI